MNGLGRGDQNDKKEKHSLITRETVGMTLLLFSAVALLIALTRSLMFGEVGVAITAFLLGCCGYLAYPLLILLICGSLELVSGKRFLPRKWVLWGAALVSAVFLIVHLATSTRFLGDGASYGAYLAACFTAGEPGIAGSTAGGILFGLIVYPLQAMLAVAGAYVVFAFLLAVLLFLCVRTTPLWNVILNAVERRRDTSSRKTPSEEGTRAYPDTFDELSGPSRVAGSLYARQGSERPSYPPQSYQGEQYGQPPVQEPAAPSYTMPAQPSQQAWSRPAAPEEGKPQTSSRTGREILFSSTPASSYRDNLIFDRDSRFNSQPRGSNVSVPPVPERPADAPASYQESFLRETEAPRPAMPRKVEMQTPSDPDLNYPQTPAYRAEEVEESRPVDYYRQDVPLQEASDEDYGEFSSAPNIDDLPEEGPSRAAEFSARETEYTEPPRDGMRGEEEAAPAAAMPAAEEERPAELPRSSFGADRVTRRELPAEDAFRRDAVSPDLSRPAAEDPLPQPPSRDFSRGAAAQGDPIRFDGQGTGFPARDDAPVPQSRALDGLRAAEPEESDADIFDDDGPEEEVPLPPSRDRAARRTEAPLTPIPDAPAPAPARHIYKAYVCPSIEKLKARNDGVTVTQEEIDRNSAIIVDTLAGFRVDASVIRVTTGSAVTRYDIDIPKDIPVSTVTKRSEEIAMRLHARDGVNMYPNRERGAISIEVPNRVRATVGLRSVMESDAFRNAKPESLTFAIGKDVEGRAVCEDIIKMKHVLVAGATGSGKSVCLNAMLISLICKYSPEDLRLILIDPKKVEFAVYDGLPHLMINEIIADSQKAVTALNWAIKEMERRYLLFEAKTRSGTLVHNIQEYNRCCTPEEGKLPKILIVVDELADLMSVAKKDIEERIQRLTQKARAAGLHLVIATQRPSVDVITGVIKGNLPARMAFRVIQEVDSRTILDESGAEKLLGNGDMLYRMEGMFSCSRVQGAFLEPGEVQAIVQDVKSNNESYFDPTVADYINNTSQEGTGSTDEREGGEVGPEYIKALGIVVQLGTASISLIQRKCSVGYNHAGKIIEWMDSMGYISPFDGKAKARTVLLTKEEFESKFGSLD